MRAVRGVRILLVLNIVLKSHANFNEVETEQLTGPRQKIKYELIVLLLTLAFGD